MTETLTPQQAVYRLATSYIPARALYAATKLDIPGHIGDERLAIPEIAAKIGVAPRPLFSLLHLLAHFDIVSELADEGVSLTATGQFLRSDHPQSLRPMVLMFHEEVYEAFDEIVDAVATGAPTFDSVHGAPLFEYMATNTSFEALFHKAMNGGQQVQNPSIVNSYDFTQLNHIVDVGGGNGALLFAILDKFQHLRGTLLERGPAVAAARADAGSRLPRCRLVEGDFFEEIPEGGDLYVLKQIIHDWPDDAAIRILRNCRSAMSGNSRLLVIDRLVGTPKDSLLTKIAALLMLHVTGGSERTEPEFRDLFEKAGLTLQRVIETPSDLFLLECVIAE